MKYTEQDLKEEYEQAVKRKGKLYAEGYVEGLKDAQNQSLTIPVVSQQRELLNRFLDWQDEDNGMENDKEWNNNYLDRYFKSIL